MEYSGFLWNKCSGATLDDCEAIDTDLFVRKPFIGTFVVKIMEFLLAKPAPYANLRSSDWQTLILTNYHIWPINWC